MVETPRASDPVYQISLPHGLGITTVSRVKGPVTPSTYTHRQSQRLLWKTSGLVHQHDVTLGSGQEGCRDMADYHLILMFEGHPLVHKGNPISLQADCRCKMGRDHRRRIGDDQRQGDFGKVENANDSGKLEYT